MRAEAEIRIWTPLLALIADKFAADAEGEGRERYDDDVNDEAEGWSTWCLSEGVRLVLQYIETRDARLQRSNPFTTQSAGLKRKQKGAEVAPFAHDADYLGFPDEVEEEDGGERTAVAGIEGGGAEDVEQQEKEEFIACLVGWLAFFLGASSSSTTTNNTTSIRSGNNTTTGKRRRAGQLGDSLPLEIVAGGAQESGAGEWTVGPRGRRSVVKELVKRLDVDVVKGAWEMSVQEVEDGQEERIEKQKLVR
ncbi:hypothetical protein QFC22_004692 [Naganishia vaughanmartiniae]|uniref:Uncharacterized protein n=1 Tax=Naganishia vaughanmartiniae TaxID=1424756 RepID=A0ACC2WZY5_9TREE|nr:hypothetical protein QFC22_004692 [Naganishia vaughanmartiniae]